MDWKSRAAPLHAVSLRCDSWFLSPAVHTAQIEPRSPRRRSVNRIACGSLVITMALLVGCSESMIRGGSLFAGSNLSGGSNISVPPQDPIAPPQEPSPPPQEPVVTPEDPIVPPQEPIVLPQDPIATPEEPTAPSPEPTSPTPEPTVIECGSGLAAQDLAGQCRASPPTPGALEAVAETSAAGITVASLTVSQTAARVLQVGWQPFGDNASGYLVYYGTTADTANALVSDLPTNSGLINPAAPSVTYDSVRDLGLYVGDTVCFRIHAYNSARTVIAEAFLGCSAI